MLFKQSELGSALDEASRLLEGSSYLTDAESAYHPSMLPIRENSRLGLNMIKLEDFVEYALDNGISDASYALNSVCEANDVDPSSVGFSIDEVSAIYDDEMTDTAMQLKEAGIPVFANPISSLDPIYQITEAVVDTMIEYAGTESEDYADSLFEAFINDDYSTVLSEAEVIDKIKSGAESAKNAVVGAVSDAKKFASKKLASLRKKLRELQKKASTATGEAKVFLSKQIDKVKQAIAHLKAKLKKSFKNS